MQAVTDKRSLSLSATGPLYGRIAVPGDKSISHRALMFGALAVGETRVRGLLTGEDVLATAAALRAMGAQIEISGTDAVIHGVGVGGLMQPDDVIDCGNSGTSARLLMGLLATHPLTVTMTGDASLRSRPMGRVTTPLSRFGARFEGADDRLPITVIGSDEPLPSHYDLPVPSAQVKSAILLAGLNTPGRTSVREPKPTRDHSEQMLRQFGVDVATERQPDGSALISLQGQCELTATEIDVPGDISSAAFPMVAALITPGSDVTIEGVGLSETRDGLLTAVRQLGGNVTVERNPANGEPVGTIRIRASALRANTIPAELAPLMIDEYPILMVAAALAEGVTEMHGLEELRVKESDRLAVMAEGLAACGVPIEMLDDGIRITGSDGQDIPGGARIDARLDHRIAMSFAILGLRAKRPIIVEDAVPVETSFPGFAALMKGLGCSVNQHKHEDGPE